MSEERSRPESQAVPGAASREDSAAFHGALCAI